MSSSSSLHLGSGDPSLMTLLREIVLDEKNSRIVREKCFDAAVEIAGEQKVDKEQKANASANLAKNDDGEERFELRFKECLRPMSNVLFPDLEPPLESTFLEDDNEHEVRIRPSDEELICEGDSEVTRAGPVLFLVRRYREDGRPITDYTLDPSLNDTLTVGRSAKSDIVVDHPKISRRHCQFKFLKDERQWGVQLLTRMSGIYVNGERISVLDFLPGDDCICPIFVGDVICVGMNDEFEVRDDNGTLLRPHHPSPTSSPNHPDHPGSPIEFGLPDVSHVHRPNALRLPDSNNNEDPLVSETLREFASVIIPRRKKAISKSTKETRKPVVRNPVKLHQASSVPRSASGGGRIANQNSARLPRDLYKEEDEFLERGEELTTARSKKTTLNKERSRNPYYVPDAFLEIEGLSDAYCTDGDQDVLVENDL